MAFVHAGPNYGVTLEITESLALVDHGRSCVD
jgi:hypothetical protein